MRSRHRQVLTFFTTAALATGMFAVAGPAFAQATAKQAPARKPVTTGNPGVAKTQTQGKAAANPMPPKAVVDPVMQRKMEDLLVRWEAQSKKVKSLKVSFERKDKSVLFDTTTIYKGQARLSPDRIYLDFYEVDEKTGKPKEAFDQLIISDGENVYQFLGPTKQIFVYPLDKDPNVKAMNQGPLPFLFDMSVAKAKQRYDMVLSHETPTAYMILIIPKLKIDREEYSQALIKLNKDRFLPEAIRLFDPANGEDTKTFNFPAKDSLVENIVIPPDWFDGKKWVKHYMSMKDPKNPTNKWTIEVNPRPTAPQDNKAMAAPGQGGMKAKAAGPIGTKPAAKGAGTRQK